MKKRARAPLRSKRFICIPDTQVKPGANTDHLEHIGRYIAEKRFDVIVMLGDHADMESLSSYDKGKRSFEGRRYRADINAAKEGMLRLTDPFMIKGYNPRMVLTLGNHEDRIRRATEETPELDGTISVDDLEYESFGWEVIPFLKIIKIDGFNFSHYITTGAMGRAATSAAACMRQVMGSVVVGHNQATDAYFHPKTQQLAVMAGTAYTHKESYLGQQGNNQRRQVLVLNEVDNGHADPMFVSLAYLKRKYAGKG